MSVLIFRLGFAKNSALTLRSILCQRADRWSALCFWSCSVNDFTELDASGGQLSTLRAKFATSRYRPSQ